MGCTQNEIEDAVQRFREKHINGWKPKLEIASYSSIHLFAEVDIENREISFVVKKNNIPELRYGSDEMDIAIAQYNYWINE